MSAKLFYTPNLMWSCFFYCCFYCWNYFTKQVNIQTHKTASDADFYSINPKGNVPALVLVDGTLLNENAAVLQYIADLKPGSIAPLNGTIDRVILQNILSYLSSEVHPSIGGLFNPTLGDETKQFIRSNAAKKLSYIETHLLADKSFLLADSFSIVDSYLYIILSWTKYVAIDLSPYPKVSAYFDRIAALPNVKAAHDRIATSPSTTF